MREPKRFFTALLYGPWPSQQHEHALARQEARPGTFPEPSSAIRPWQQQSSHVASKIVFAATYFLIFRLQSSPLVRVQGYLAVTRRW